MYKLDEIVKELTEKIRKLEGVSDNDVIYQYDAVTKEYNIIHNFQDKINNDDELALSLAELFSTELFEKGFYSVNFYEDETVLNRNTLSIKLNSSPRQSWIKDESDGFRANITTNFSVAA